MSRYIFLFLAVSFLAASASASQIEKKNSWVLEEVKTADGAICIASTDKGVIRNYTLKIQKVKNSHLPVEIFIHEKGKPKYGPLAMAKVNAEVVLFNQFSIEEKSQSFWYLPDETLELLTLLKTSEKTFEVDPFGDLEGSTIRFSLKGAKEILAAMEKHCNQGQSLIDDRFSKLTNHPSAFDQNPKLFDVNALADLRTKYYGLAEYHKLLLNEEAKLLKLTEQNKPNILERNNLRLEKSDLEAKKIPTLKQDIQATTLRIDQSERRLAQLKTEIPAAEKLKAQAQARYAEALKKIEPHTPKYNDLYDDVSYAEAQLSGAISGISSAEYEIASNNGKISQLDSRAQSLSQEIQRLRSVLPQAQYEADRRRRDYESFNASYEIQKRLSESYRYRQLRDEVERLRRDLQDKRQAVRELERALSSAQVALNQCQSVVGNDCTAQISRVSELQSQLRTKKSEADSVENNLDYKKREMDSIERDIERDVRRIENDLREEYDRAQSRLNSIVSQLSQAEGERRDIMEYQIPRLRDRNNELRYEIANLESRLPALRQNLKTAEAALAKFDQSVGYSNLAANLEKAESQLSDAKAKLENLVSENSRLTTLLAQDKTRLTQLKDNLKSSEARLVLVNQRLVQLDKELSGFDSAKKAIEDVMAGIQNQTKDLQLQYMSYFK